MAIPRLPLTALAKIVAHLIDSIAKIALPIAKVDVFMQLMGTAGMTSSLSEECVQSTRNSWFSAENSPTVASALASREQLFSEFPSHSWEDGISAFLTTTRFSSRYTIPFTTVAFH